jgi:hypothetical protein
MVMAHFKAPHRPPPAIVARGLGPRWLAAKLTTVPAEQLDDVCHALDADGRHDPATVEAARAFTLNRRGLPHAERAAPTKPIALGEVAQLRKQKRDAAAARRGPRDAAESAPEVLAAAPAAPVPEPLPPERRGQGRGRP